MSRNRITFHNQNKAMLEKLCRDEGYEIHWLDEYHARVLSGTTITDIWTPRMKFNVLNIDGVLQPNKYRQLDMRFNREQVKKLLESGKLV